VKTDSTCTLASVSTANERKRMLSTAPKGFTNLRRSFRMRSSGGPAGRFPTNSVRLSLSASTS